MSTQQVRRFAFLTLAVSLLSPAHSRTAGTPGPEKQDRRPTVIVVVGAAGTPEYGRRFADWAARWSRAAEQAGARLVQIGGDGEADGSDRGRLRDALDDADHQRGRLWLVLIGHGTFDGRTARFNLRGRDLAAAELQEWLAPIERPTAVINCASSSGPFVNRLSRSGRVVVTATKSGFEHNFARFGGYLARAIADPGADLDKDGQTSLLEAWLQAARRTEEFYGSENRLLTEHALLEDNGDGRAVRVDFFRGVRPVKRPSGGAAIDGFRAHQWHLVRSRSERRMDPALRRRRDELELQIVHLRSRKSDFAEDVYYGRLERLLVPLAEIYEQADRRPARAPVPR